jgi:hypothetical protein
MRGDSKMKGPSMRLDLVTRTIVSVDARCLARTCLCSERTEKAWPRGGAADRFLVFCFGCVVEPA